MIKEYLKIIVVLMSGHFAAYCQAGDTYITLNDARHFNFPAPISTVFISTPDIADYQVIDDQTLVVFAKEVGQARLIVYGLDNQVLLSQRILVDIDLSQIRRQVKLHFPQLDIKLESVGEQVSVSGQVESEQERDDVYRLVATLLNRETVARYQEIDKFTFPDSDLEEPEGLIFARNNRWKGIVENIEVLSVQQVNVKISVAQVTESFANTIGVDWGTVGVGIGQFAFAELKAADLTTLITALGDETMAEVLAEPNLTVLSGESASFLVGGEVPVIVSTNNNVNISFKEFGIKLDLTAKVMSNEKVRMLIAPEVSEVEQYIKSAGLEVPQFASRKAMTTVELADGQSFILAGLMNNHDFEQLQKIPLLGDVPVLGALFRKSVTERKKSELVIVATVNLVRPTSPQEVQLPYINKTATLERWFNINRDKTTDAEQALGIDLLSQGGFMQ